jgi:hypothetical protein
MIEPQNTRGLQRQAAQIADSAETDAGWFTPPLLGSAEPVVVEHAGTRLYFPSKPLAVGGQGESVAGGVKERGNG